MRILPLQSVDVTCESHAPSKDAPGCAESSCCAESEAGVRIRAARAIVETSDFRVIFFIFVVFLMFLVCAFIGSREFPRPVYMANISLKAL